MYLRSAFNTKGHLRIRSDLKLPLNFSIHDDRSGSNSNLWISVRDKTKEEAGIMKNYQLAVELCMESILPDLYEKTFRQLEQQLISPKTDNDTWKYQQEDGVVVVYPELKSNYFHPGFEEEVKKQISQLSDRAKNFLTLFSWRLNEPFFELESYPLWIDFSFNTQTWYPIPRNKGPEVRPSAVQPTYNPLPLVDNLKTGIVGLAGERIGEGAPIYHELLTEAFKHRRNRNPKGALVMGAAALESTVKQCISALVPNTSWLLNSIQSPPISKILRDYIPTIPTKNLVNGKVHIPKSLRKTVHTGIEARNKILHTGSIAESDKNLESYCHNISSATYHFLYAVQDIVWLLDYYQGQDWALDYVSKTTLESMGIENQGMTISIL